MAWNSLPDFIQRAAQTVLGVYLKRTCSRLTSVSSALGVLIAKFHYTGPTGPDQTKSADVVGDPGLRPGSREKVRAGPVGSV